MKTHTLVAIVFAASFAIVGCTPTQKGAVGGGAIGAGAGALIGGEGNRAEGALIGGAVGALGGAALGANKEKKQAQQAQQYYGPGYY